MPELDKTGPMGQGSKPKEDKGIAEVMQQKDKCQHSEWASQKNNYRIRPKK